MKDKDTKGKEREWKKEGRKPPKSNLHNSQEKGGNKHWSIYLLWAIQR